jgi:O-antigen/teichoic acid export membrane protein
MPFFLNVMTTEDFGQYSLYQTYIGIFGIFFGLNVSSAIVRYYVDRTDGKKYLATAIWIVVCFSFVFHAWYYGCNMFLIFLRWKVK